MAAPPLRLPTNQPLGVNPYDADVQHLWSSAYNQCLQFQIGDSQQQLYARCLGYLLQEAIDETSRDYIAAEIIRFKDDVQKLNDLAKFYINHVFRLFRQNKGGTPAPSSHRSRDSFESPEKSFYAGPVESAPKDHSSAKKAALRRDGYRCMVTGGYDIGYTLNLPVTALDTLLAAGSKIASTHLAHVFPPSTNKGINSEVYRYAHIDVQQELDGPQVHSLCNVLTLSTEMHSSFDNLMLWFEEVSNSPNTYHVCATHPFFLADVPNRVVTFTSTDDALPLPDPRYLKFHAAICRVAHLSGAAEYLNAYDREHEERGVMAHDGTSAEYLTAKLNSVSAW